MTAGQQHVDNYFIQKGAYGLSRLCLHGKEGCVCKWSGGDQAGPLSTLNTFDFFLNNIKGF